MLKMIKEIFIGIVVVICIMGAYLYGYNDHMESVPNNCTPIIEWKTVNVPVVQDCNCSVSEISCENTNTIITNTDEIVIYKNVSSNKYKADVYYQVFLKEIEGYYDNIRHDEYDECNDKLNRGQDYLLNSIGFYQASDQDFTYKIKAYEELRKVMLKILTYCSGYEDLEGVSFEDIRDDYEPNYDKYSRYLGYINETPIYLK